MDNSHSKYLICFSCMTWGSYKQMSKKLYVRLSFCTLYRSGGDFAPRNVKLSTLILVLTLFTKSTAKGQRGSI